MFNPLENLKRLIAQINSVANKGADRVRQRDSSSNPILHSEFREHKLSTRLINALEKTDIVLVQDVLKYSKAQLLLLPQMGEKSIKELENFLSAHNICWPTNTKPPIQESNLFPEIQDSANILEISKNVANKKFEDQNLSTRLINILKREKIYQIGDILSYSEWDLFALPNMGGTTLKELKEFLSSNGILLGQKYQIVDEGNQLPSESSEKPLKFKEAISQLYDDRTATIILERYAGETLEEIAQKFGLTRERVRQICGKLSWNKLGKIEEDKYKDIFIKYAWKEADSFCQIFQEDKTCYYYLKFRYGYGKLSLNKLAKESSLTDTQRNAFLVLFKGILNDAGQIVFREEVLGKLVKKYALNKISLDEFSEKYNLEIDKYPELKFKKITPHILRGRLNQREDIIWCGDSSFRYYDFSILPLNELEKLLPSADGFYSAMYIFRENKDLMAAWDIRDKNELHSILKSCIHKQNISFSRMPGFSIGSKNKKSFLLEQAQKYSPITVNELAKILSDYYGHDERTMSAALFSDLAPYIVNDSIDVQVETISLSEKDHLNRHLTADIYTIDEVTKILISLGYSPQKILRRYTCQQLGYVLYSDFILSSHFGTIINYLNYVVEAKGVISVNDSICKLPTIRQQMFYLQKDRKIFRLTEDFWVTQTKLDTIGVSKDTVSNLLESIFSLFRNKDFFSVYNVLDEIDYTKFEEKGLSEVFLENLLMSMDGIETLRIFHNRLFSFTFQSVTINWFVRYLVGQYGKITLLDLSKEIARKYQLQVSTEKLKGILGSLDDVFYSDILEKIYLDKKDYYEEIYDEK